MAEPSTFQLQIVSPAKLVFSGTVTLVEVPGVEGDFGVLPGHSPLFSMIRPGIITIHEGAQKTFMLVEGGYADVTADVTTILAESIRDVAFEDVAAEQAALAARVQATPEAVAA